MELRFENGAVTLEIFKRLKLCKSPAQTLRVDSEQRGLRSNVTFHLGKYAEVSILARIIARVLVLMFMFILHTVMFALQFFALMEDAIYLLSQFLIPKSILNLEE